MIGAQQVDSRGVVLPLTAALNKLTGVSCQTIQGALYAFPQITLPAAFVKEAEKAGKKPDTLYCLKLLQSTGVSVDILYPRVRALFWVALAGR